MNAAVGVALAPRRTLQAFRDSTPGRSLFGLREDYASLLDRTVGELRELLALPEGGLAKRPRERHAHAPSLRV